MIGATTVPPEEAEVCLEQELIPRDVISAPRADPRTAPTPTCQVSVSAYHEILLRGSSKLDRLTTCHRDKNGDHGGEADG